MEKLRAAYRVVVIIGLAMMASLLVYLIIVGLFEKGGRGPALPDSAIEMMKFALVAMSVVLFFLIRFLNARILAAGRERGELRDARQQPEVAPVDIQRLTTAAVVTYALCEAPAIFGLVLFFLGGQASDFHLFLLISLFFFATKFPKFSQWEEWHRQRQGQALRRT